MNASAAINRLPVELLVEIFKYLRHMPFTRWDVVLRVCRRWFVIGATTPKLWCQLKASKSTNFLRTGLARSRNLEVDLEVCQVGGYAFLTSETLSVIAPHCHRVRTLTFGMIGASEVGHVVEFLSTNAMPALRWLEARVELRPGLEGSNSDTPAIALPPDRFPKLEEVHLTRLNVFVPTPVFAQLKVLDLSSYSGREPTFSLGTLIEIVRSMEKVEELTLYEIHIPDMSARPPAPPSDRVTFHKLRNLQLALAAPALKRLLAEMIIPPTTDVYMRVVRKPDGQQEEELESLARYLPDDRSSLTVLSNLVHADVRVLSWEHSFDGYSSLDHRKADPEITIPGHLHLATDFADMRTDDGNALDLGDPLRVLRGAPLEVLQIECAPVTVGDIAASRRSSRE